MEDARKVLLALEPARHRQVQDAILGGTQHLLGALYPAVQTNWCGLRPVDWRNICEKWVMLKPVVFASSSRLKSLSISTCTSSTTFRKRAGVNPPRYIRGDGRRNA